jgi:hypothetical protein
MAVPLMAYRSFSSTTATVALISAIIAGIEVAIARPMITRRTQSRAFWPSLSCVTRCKSTYAGVSRRQPLAANSQRSPRSPYLRHHERSRRLPAPFSFALVGNQRLGPSRMTRIRSASSRKGQPMPFPSSRSRRAKGQPSPGSSACCSLRGLLQDYHSSCIRCG